MKFVATGTRKIKDKVSGETRYVSVLLPLTEETRVRAVHQAERIAKRDRIILGEVVPLRNQQSQGGILTKETLKRKQNRK